MKTRAKMRCQKLSFWFLFLVTTTVGAQTVDLHPGAKCLLARAKQLMTRNDAALQIVPLLDEANAIFARTAPEDPAFAEALEWRAIFYRPVGPNQSQQWRKNSATIVQRALEIRECHSSLEPDELALALELQADVLGRTEEGTSYWQRAQIIRRAHVASIQPEVPKALTALEQKTKPDDLPPTIAKQIEPEYSLVARHAGLECFGVVLAFVIDPAGIPGEFRLKQGCGYGLDEKAVEAVRQWRFHPALREGQPIAVSATVDVNFKLVP